MKQFFVVTVVAFAFFIQALIPVGFMPAFAKDGIQIEICAGMQAKTINLDDTPADKKGHENADYCAFAVPGHFDVSTVAACCLSNPAFLAFINLDNRFHVPDSIPSSHHSRAPPFQTV